MTAGGDPLLGARIARQWDVVRRIGAGGMGVVYEVVAAPGIAAPPGPLALKLLAPHLLGDEEVVSRFLAEGAIAARLIHPNIVRVHAFGRAEDGAPFLLMERLAGTPLSAYTNAGRRVPPTQAVAILQGALAGLAAAHAQGVVHRDLKPDNIFLARTGDGAFTPKILDFGIAKVMDTLGGPGARTKTGMLLGTPAYMSPEQIRTVKLVDPRSDLFSLSVMGWEMLTGQAAFPAENEFAKLTEVLAKELPPVDAVDPTLAPLAPVLARGLAKDRERRWPSAAAYAQALAEVWGGATGAHRMSQLPEPNGFARPIPGTPSAIPAPPSVAPAPIVPAPPPSALPAPAQAAAPAPGGVPYPVVAGLCLAAMAVGVLVGLALGRLL